MRWFWQSEGAPPDTKEASLESVLQQIAALYETVSGIVVNAETCMQSPTVHAIVTAVSNRISVSPVSVFSTSRDKNGRLTRKNLPTHPIQLLLNKPNEWQTSEEYFGDQASSLLRHGRFFAYKGMGTATEKIQFLDPIVAGVVEIKQDTDTRRISYVINGRETRLPRQMHYSRLAARDYLRGDSPIFDVRESIALEIAAERHGASFFANGAMPLIFFKLMEGFKDIDDEQKKDFLTGVKSAFGGDKKFSTMMLPKGMELDQLQIDNDKAQFIESRRFIRTVIAGAFGVPPHMVGDLERATFNNVEQQDTDFSINVVMPIAKRIEAAMERDLLTDADREAGVIIRFDLDAVERADVKSRTESLKTGREWGAINANEWRERIGLNPLSEEDGGEDYIRPLNMQTAGEEPPITPAPTGEVTDDD